MQHEDRVTFMPGMAVDYRRLTKRSNPFYDPFNEVICAGTIDRSLPDMPHQRGGHNESRTVTGLNGRRVYDDNSVWEWYDREFDDLLRLYVARDQSVNKILFDDVLKRRHDYKHLRKTLALPQDREEMQWNPNFCCEDGQYYELDEEALVVNCLKWPLRVNEMVEQRDLAHNRHHLSNHHVWHFFQQWPASLNYIGNDWSTSNHWAACAARRSACYVVGLLRTHRAPGLDEVDMAFSGLMCNLLGRGAATGSNHGYGSNDAIWCPKTRQWVTQTKAIAALHKDKDFAGTVKSLTPLYEKWQRHDTSGGGMYSAEYLDSLIQYGVNTAMDSETLAGWVTKVVCASWHTLAVCGEAYVRAIAWAVRHMETVHGMPAEEAYTVGAWAATRHTAYRMWNAPVAVSATRDLKIEDSQASLIPVSPLSQLKPWFIIADDASYFVTHHKDEADSNLARALRTWVNNCINEVSHESTIMTSKDYTFASTLGRRIDCEVRTQYVSIGADHKVIPCSGDARGEVAVLFNISRKDGDWPLYTRRDTGHESGDYIVIHDDEFTLKYMALDTCDIKRGNTRGMQHMGCVLRGGIPSRCVPMASFMQHFETDYESLLSVEDRVKRLCDLGVPEITRAHHQHASMIDILANCGGWWHNCLDHILMAVDMNAVAFSTMYLALSVLPSSILGLMVCWAGWGSECLGDFTKKAKALSIAMKGMDNLVYFGNQQLDLAPLFEWETVVNRGHGKSTWQTEMRERRDPSQQVNVPLVDLKPYIYGVMRQMRSKIRALKGDASPLKMDWCDFYKMRSRNTPSGSVGTNVAELRGYKDKVSELAPLDMSKTLLVSALPDDMDIRYFTQRPPSLDTTKSWKFEWGKQRALYASVLEHYILAAFAFNNCEYYMPRNCPVGQAASAKHVCARVCAMAKEGIPVCWDAKNFNIAHRLDVMSAAVQAYGDVMGDLLSPDQQLAVRWLAAAELKARIRVEEKDMDMDLWAEGRRQGWIERDEFGYMLNVIGGLFSGHRLTMFLNTTLNAVYYAYGCAAAGIRQNALHSGDDVFDVRATVGEAFRLRRAFADMSYHMQLSKCYMGSVVEFLRISHKNANTSQYLSRSCATLIHGRVETDEARDCAAMLAAHVRRASEAVVRYGLRVTLLSLLQSRMGATASRWSIPAVVVSTFTCMAKEKGGLMLSGYANGCSARLMITRTVSQNRTRTNEVSALPGIRLAAQEICDELKMWPMVPRASRAIAAVVAPKSIMRDYGMLVEYVPQVIRRKCVNKAGSGVYLLDNRDFILAKSVGLVNAIIAVEPSRFPEIASVRNIGVQEWESLLISCTLSSAEAIQCAFAEDKADLWPHYCRISALLSGESALDPYNTQSRVEGRDPRIIY